MKNWIIVVVFLFASSTWAGSISSSGWTPLYPYRKLERTLYIGCSQNLYLKLKTEYGISNEPGDQWQVGISPAGGPDTVASLTYESPTTNAPSTPVQRLEFNVDSIAVSDAVHDNQAVKVELSSPDGQRFIELNLTLEPNQCHQPQETYWRSMTASCKGYLMLGQNRVPIENGNATLMSSWIYSVEQLDQNSHVFTTTQDVAGGFSLADLLAATKNLTDLSGSALRGCPK